MGQEIKEKLFEMIKTKQLLPETRISEMKQLVDSGMSGMEAVFYLVVILMQSFFGVEQMIDELIHIVCTGDELQVLIKKVGFTSQL